MELLESATFHLADDAVLSFAPLYREHSASLERLGERLLPTASLPLRMRFFLVPKGRK
jgi:hypothetical protein